MCKKKKVMYLFFLIYLAGQMRHLPAFSVVKQYGIMK